MPDIDWDAAYCTQNLVQNRFVIILLVDDVANRTRAGELQNERVHPGDVVGHKKESASRQIFQTERGHPIKATHQWPANEIERAFGGGRGNHRL